MTRQILLRSPKSPFETTSAETALSKNLLGHNSGNLVFLETAYKILDTRDAEITPDRFAAYKMGADEINERFDVYVIPLANAFRATFGASLARLTKVLEGLKIPVVVLGAGLQAPLPYVSGTPRRFDEGVKAFAKAVLDRSASIGVRGEYTQDYLQRLGFRDVEVIGCPSMYYRGDQLSVTKRVPGLTPESRIAINLTRRVSDMAPIVASHVEKYPNLEYIAQENETLRLLLWHEDVFDSPPDYPMPSRVDHPLIRDDKTRLFLDPWPWLEYMRGFEFSFGNRIHGNIVGLLAGTPSYVIAHDTRTLELARYFQIPHREAPGISPDTDAAELYEEADFGPMIAGHGERFRTFIDYMERHGLHHIFEPGEDQTKFDRQIAEVDYPPPVRLKPRTIIRRARRRTRLTVSSVAARVGLAKS
jgi:hypothetical protein